MHRPIILNNISLFFQNKTCFEDFSAQIYPDSRIAIIGRNGSGKSSLLNIIARDRTPSEGEMTFPEGLKIGHLEQTITDFKTLSGGQRLNKRLTEVLSKSPDLLLLDEPTNHLDAENRRALMRHLSRFRGALVIVTHDSEVLRHCIDTLWHIGPLSSREGGASPHNQITQFTGSYDDYQDEIRRQRDSIGREFDFLKREKKESHKALMKEQKRAAKSRSKGKKSIDQKKWPSVVSKAKALRAEQTSGKKRSAIDKKKQGLSEQLSNLRLPEMIKPKFSLEAGGNPDKVILSIFEADIGYRHGLQPILRKLSLSVKGNEKVAIEGPNGSGKSTLLKAIMGSEKINKSGHWDLPRRECIAYLDQHYDNLNPNFSLMDHIKDLQPGWTETEVRRHLNDFLFRKNEEVTQFTKTLSGGEKARASLSIIAADPPRLLILDEVTNNLDLETKEHVTQVLREYPGAMIIVSHEEGFLKAINVDQRYKIDELGVI